MARLIRDTFLILHKNKRLSIRVFGFYGWNNDPMIGVDMTLTIIGMMTEDNNGARNVGSCP
jgi:hypothetical protein